MKKCKFEKLIGRYPNLKSMCGLSHSRDKCLVSNNSEKCNCFQEEKNDEIIEDIITKEEQIILLKIKSLLSHINYFIKDEDKFIIDEFHKLCRKHCSWEE